MSDYIDDDRRQYERKNFDAKNGQINFKLKINNETYEIYKVHDSTIAGMRLSLIAIKLEVDQALTLLVTEGEFSLSVNAVVRWNAPGSELDIYEHGIEFDNSDLDLNLLLFMHLRKNMFYS